MTIEEFISGEIDKGHIKAGSFNKDKKLIKVHGHCHQKSIFYDANQNVGLPEGHTVHMILLVVAEWPDHLDMKRSIMRSQ